MSFKVAFPSDLPGGLDAQLSGHFGHCDLFTVVTIENGQAGDVEALPNMPHEQGGCMAPVNYLASNGIKALVAGGMGMRPLMGFNQVGIEVFHNGGLPSVGQALAAFTEGRLPKFGQNMTCGGQAGGGGGCGSH